MDMISLPVLLASTATARATNTVATAMPNFHFRSSFSSSLPKSTELGSARNHRYSVFRLRSEPPPTKFRLRGDSLWPD